MKQFLSTVMAFFLVLLPFTCGVPAEAADLSPNSVMVPNYTYIWQMSAGLKISSTGKAHCSGSVDTSSRKYNGDLTITLQKKVSGTWTDVKSWSDSGPAQLLIVEEDYYVTSGTYRVRTTAKISNTSGTLLEEQSMTSAEKTY